MKTILFDLKDPRIQYLAKLWPLLRDDGITWDEFKILVGVTFRTPYRISSMSQSDFEEKAKGLA